MKCFFNILFLLLIFGHNFSQGIYAPTTGVVGTTAIHKDSSIIVSWASNCSVKKGLMQIDDSTLGYVTQGDSADAIGIADGVTVSLGDNGVAIYSLNIPVYNGNGNDFTVFENGFNNTFLELAFVEVSSDGINYFRFPSKSKTTPDVKRLRQTSQLIHRQSLCQNHHVRVYLSS